MHPVAQCLAVHRARFRRELPRPAFQNQADFASIRRAAFALPRPCRRIAQIRNT